MKKSQISDQNKIKEGQFGEKKKIFASSNLAQRRLGKNAKMNGLELAVECPVAFLITAHNRKRLALRGVAGGQLRDGDGQNTVVARGSGLKRVEPVRQLKHPVKHKIITNNCHREKGPKWRSLRTAWPSFKSGSKRRSPEMVRVSSCSRTLMSDLDKPGTSILKYMESWVSITSLAPMEAVTVEDMVIAMRRFSRA